MDITKLATNIHEEVLEGASVSDVMLLLQAPEAELVKLKKHIQVVLDDHEKETQEAIYHSERYEALRKAAGVAVEGLNYVCEQLPFAFKWTKDLEQIASDLEKAMKEEK
jgi:hypothetical protein